MSFSIQNAPQPFGAHPPGFVERAVLALTAALPDTWLGLAVAIALREPVAAYLARSGRNVARDVGRWGLALRLHPLDNGCENELLFRPQMYEPAGFSELKRDIAAARKDLRPFVFIDAGANVGLFSLFVAAQTGPNARILAIEPEPRNLARLTFNIASNPGLPIRPIALALAEEEGETAIAVNRSDREQSRMRPLSESNSGDTVRVPCRPLLTLLRVQDIAVVDALKIAVGGMEERLLRPFFRDAPPSLWPKTILMEYARHEGKADLFALLAAKGYVIAAHTRRSIVLRLAAPPPQTIEHRPTRCRPA